MVKPLRRSLLAVIAAFVATDTATCFAQQVPIDQRLPGIMPRWTEQSDKKVRYAGYSLWMTAYDSAVRQANRAMCGAYVRRWVQNSRITGIGGAQVAWRTGTARAYDWLVGATYFAGDVVWVDPRTSGGLSVGDIVLEYRLRTELPPGIKVKLPPGIRLPGRLTGDATFDAIVAGQDAMAGVYLLYRSGTFSLLSAGSRTSAEGEPLACRGQSRLNPGGWAIDLLSTVHFATGFGKSLLDDDVEYVQGGSPSFRRFTADVFTPDQLKWMIVDQFAVDLTVYFFSNPQALAFDEAFRRALAKAAARMGVPAESDAFGLVSRAKAVYLGVYAGYNMGLTEAGYLDFLDARERVLHGRTDANKARMRADLIHQWFAELPRRTGPDGTAVPDVAASIALM